MLLRLHAPHSTRRVSGSYQGGSGHHRACIRISRGESPRRRRGLLRASASAPSSGLKLLRTAQVIPDLERGNLPVTHHLHAMSTPSSAHSGVLSAAVILTVQALGLGQAALAVESTPAVQQQPAAPSLTRQGRLIGPTPAEVENANVATGVLNNRLRGCDGRPNCISTTLVGAGVAGTSSCPWVLPKAQNPSAALRSIRDTILEQTPEALLVDEQGTGDGPLYVRYEVPGKFGTDLVEVSVTAKRAPAVKVENENENEGDTPPPEPPRVDGIIGFRSLATKINYIYPFQTPVPDIDSQRERLERVRTALGKFTSNQPRRTKNNNMH